MIYMIVHHAFILYILNSTGIKADLIAQNVGMGYFTFYIFIFFANKFILYYRQIKKQYFSFGDDSNLYIALRNLDKRLDSLNRFSGLPSIYFSTAVL